MNDEIQQLLDRLSKARAERAASWLLWSLIARRLALTVIPLAWAAAHLLH